MPPPSHFFLSPSTIVFHCQACLTRVTVCLCLQLHIPPPERPPCSCPELLGKSIPRRSRPRQRSEGDLWAAANMWILFTNRLRRLMVALKTSGLLFCAVSQQFIFFDCGNTPVYELDAGRVPANGAGIDRVLWFLDEPLVVFASSYASRSPSGFTCWSQLRPRAPRSYLTIFVPTMLFPSSCYSKNPVYMKKQSHPLRPHMNHPTPSP
ncbi:hypothetical protein HDK77DRAFT_296539 [Phyllosticta capitalensis]